jgi:hypothetical protein
MRSIQSLAAQAGREARANGLPAGEHVYSDPLKIENRYQSEADCIRAKYGSITNWRLWDDWQVKERASGETVFDNQIAKITGMSLHNPPRLVLELLDKSIYEVRALI